MKLGNKFWDTVVGWRRIPYAWGERIFDEMLMTATI